MAKLDEQVSINFKNLLRSLDLVCSNKLPTRNYACLDNVLVNFTQDLYTISVLQGALADHDPLLFKYRKPSSTNTQNANQPTLFVRKQNKQNLNLFCEALQNESWQNIVDNESNSEALFNSFFYQFVDLWYYCSPLVKKKPRSDSRTLIKKNRFNWYNDSLRKSRETMLAYNSLYKNLLKINSVKAQAAYNIYNNLKKQYRKDLTLAKKSACEKYINNSKNKCKAAWDIITQENTTTRTSHVTLDPNELNTYFTDSVEELVNQVGQTQTTPSDLLESNKQLDNISKFKWTSITPDEAELPFPPYTKQGTTGYTTSQAGHHR
ncbi:uncharacterized protein LOC128987653 [Macrosteles quadrilineatus]|uniref:uncharacterized protein LOC128987653 n=1 Tax=Macrosteles quadrilineatus TaxID=74068 RepID=UPI0023E24298|nr:uncharacterized protein LOC128987653 [Macrosteles quadrilineatus]